MVRTFKVQSQQLSSLSHSEHEVAQSCLTLCDPMDDRLPGSPSMEFSRQEYWSGLPFPSPGDLADPGIEPGSPALQADALPSHLESPYHTGSVSINPVLCIKSPLPNF